MPFEVTVHGGCMEPAIASGSTVSVVDRRWLVCGDVVVARRGGRFEAHRFLGYRPSRTGLVAITQADDATTPDTAVPIAHVIGAVDQRVSIPERWAALLNYGRALAHRLRAQ